MSEEVCTSPSSKKFRGYDHFSRTLCQCRRKNAGTSLLECPGCRNRICAPCHIGLVARKWKNGNKCCRQIRATEEFAMGILLNMSKLYEKAQELLGNEPTDEIYQNYCRCSDDSKALKCSKGHKICYSCRAGFTKSEYHEDCTECMKAAVSGEQLHRWVVWLVENEPEEITGKYRIDQLEKEEGPLFPMLPIMAIMNAADALDGYDETTEPTDPLAELYKQLEGKEESQEINKMVENSDFTVEKSDISVGKDPKVEDEITEETQAKPVPLAKKTGYKRALTLETFARNREVVKKKLREPDLGANKAKLKKVIKPLAPKTADGRRLAGIAIVKKKMEKTVKLVNVEEETPANEALKVMKPLIKEEDDNKENEVRLYDLPAQEDQEMDVDLTELPIPAEFLQEKDFVCPDEVLKMTETVVSAVR